MVKLTEIFLEVRRPGKKDDQSRNRSMPGYKTIRQLKVKYSDENIRAIEKILDWNKDTTPIKVYDKKYYKQHIENPGKPKPFKMSTYIELWKDPNEAKKYLDRIETKIKQAKQTHEDIDFTIGEAHWFTMFMYHYDNYSNKFNIKDQDIKNALKIMKQFEINRREYSREHSLEDILAITMGDEVYDPDEGPNYDD